MVKIRGVEISKNELLKKCGSISQVAGAKRCSYSEGRAKGTEFVEVNNGNGLRFTILLDRNMDIHSCEYKGINLSYITKNPITSSALYSNGEEDGWLRAFNGGLLTTCGITSAGASCTDEGEKLGIHGKIGNYPADNICSEAFWEGEDYIIKVSGNNYQTKFFGENLLLHREIRVKAGEDKIYLYDKIENLGFIPSPIMMIYHMNFGFPLLDEGTKIFTNSMNSVPTTKESEYKIKDQYIVEPPQHDIKENVYFHEMDNTKGYGMAAIYNNKIMEKGLGVYIKFNLENLPFLNQWKMMGEGEYVVGLEPSNCMTLGRDKERSRGSLRYIQPKEVKDFILEIGITEDLDKLKNIIK